jgi:hypothetical protein
MADNFTVLDGNGAPRVLRSTDSGGVHTPHQKVELPGTAEADIANTATRLATVITSLSALSGFVDGLEALQTTLAGYVDGLEAALAATLSTQVPDVTATQTLAVVNDAVTVATQGRPYASVAYSAGFTGTVAAEYTYEGTVWYATVFLNNVGSAFSTASISGAASGRTIIVPIGAIQVRTRVTIATSGSCTATARASFSGHPYLLGPLAKASAQCFTLATDDPSLTKLDTLHTDVGPASAIYDGNKNVTTAGTRVVLASSQALTKGVRVRAKDANTGLIYIGGATVSSSSDRLAPGEPTWMDVNNLALVYIDAAVNGEGVTFSAW